MFAPSHRLLTCLLVAAASATIPTRAHALAPTVREGPTVMEVPWSGESPAPVAPATAVEPPAPEPAVPERPVSSRPAPARPDTPVTTTPVTVAAPEGFARPPGEAERMAKRPLGPGITLEPGRGLSFGTADKRFSMTLNLAAQFLYTGRYTATNLEPPPMAHAGDQTFEIRRARAIFSGNVFTEHIKYYLQVQFSPRDLGLADGQAVRQSPVFMAWTAFDRFRDFTPQIGLFFINYSRQRVQPILKLQFIDFGLASSEFGLERDIGVDIGSKDLGGLGKLRYHLGLFMGDGTDFARPHDFGMTYVGRVEILPMGDFDDYVDADLARRRKPKLSIGVGYAYAHRDARNRAINGAAPTDGGTTDSNNLTADLMFKVAGLSMLGDVWLRHGRRDFGDALTTDDDGTMVPAARELPRNGVGWSAQGGFLLPRLPIEIGGRYSAIRSWGASSIQDRNEVGPAVSYYFAEHSVKLQLDHRHGWGEELLASETVRLQLTVSF